MEQIKTIVTGISVYFAGSNNLTSQTAVAIVSMAMNTKSDIDLYILDCGIPADDIRALERICEKYDNIKSFTILPVNMSLFSGCNTWFGYTDCWSRFLFSDLAPNIDKAIYLDSDIIVMNDIRKLYDLDLGGKAIAAAPEIWHLSKWHESERNDRRKKWGYSDDHVYFGSGVLIFDCKKWRDERLADKILSIGRQYGKMLKFPDQDALNILFADNYQIIDNELVATSQDIVDLEKQAPEKFMALQKNLVVRHFNVYKPFSREIYLDVSRKKVICPHLENWWYYAGMTPYYQYFLHKLNLKRLKPLTVFKLRLFGFIPFLKIKSERKKTSKKWVILFGFIPIFCFRHAD
ncbi:MAG: glycosyltransferase family 8 protein [Rickettsiales bacterium]|jgi:lipopolysaccharide biosynthesis glycosyltransferase|nr:glycosyltransferase family 8 protein [Rickettsiales bacterium]